jgi:hypothetical protein
MLPPEFHCRVPATIGKNIHNLFNENREDPCVYSIQDLIFIRAVEDGRKATYRRQKEEVKGKGTKKELHNLDVVLRCFVPKLIIFLSSKRSAPLTCASYGFFLASSEKYRDGFTSS